MTVCGGVTLALVTFMAVTGVPTATATVVTVTAVTMVTLVVPRGTSGFHHRTGVLSLFLFGISSLGRMFGLAETLNWIIVVCILKKLCESFFL